MSLKNLKTAITLAVIFAAMRIATFAQSSTTGGTGAVKVLDGDNHILGTLLGLTPSLPNEFEPSSFVVFKNGYFIALQFDGFFPVGFEYGTQIWWTGTNCTGNAYISSESPMGRRLVVYSRQSNALYVPSGGANVAPVTVKALSIESGNGETSSCSNSSSGYTETGVPLTAFDAEKLGWNLCGEPLHVMGPVEFKED